jgi:NAD(P)-dependent dehydrogenase (short-subunit alcohol dehydrogenase family)
LTLDQWNKAIAVNLTGAFLMCKFGVPELRRAGGGSIINIASQLGHLGVPLRSPYCTTKAALIHFTRILAMDHATDNIRANTISPGFILTERAQWRQGAGAHRQRSASSAQPAGRARRNRGRRALSCGGRVIVRHRDRSSDR